jgi:hypothetical protein
MTKPTALVEYSDLLRKLASLSNDSPEADAVRDKMDEPWRRMTPLERRLARGLSASLTERSQSASTSSSA